MKKERLSVREKVSYGVGDLGNNVAYGALGFYFVFFLTDVAGLSPLWAGNIFLVTRMWNAVMDMVVGGVSDRTRTRFGRRRPYLLYGALPLGLSFALLFQVLFTGEIPMILFYCLAGVLFSSMYSLVAVPYNALLPELSQEYNERTSISGYKMAFSFVGSLLSAMGVTLIVDTFYPGKALYRESYPVMGVILGAVVALCILLCFFGTRERVRPAVQQKPEPMLESLRSLLLLREYRLVLGVFIFNMVGFDVIMALYIYFMKYALKISDDVSYVFMMIPLVIAVAATPLWVKISEKLGKKRAYILSAIYFVVPLIGCIFIPAGNIPVVIVVIALIGVGISASQTLTFSILPDVVEVDELKNGVRREGTIYGMTMFLYKIGSAVLVALTTAMLGVFGYVESTGEAVAQPASAIWGIRLLIALVPALCFVLSAVFVKNLPLSKAEFEKIRQSLKSGKEG